ncbi:tetratricopeptide repeat protein [Mucilaginibacter sp.]|uniref:tetratricopeptide repeat protein n=1 Tax=Mucilaginibacter sp. TaxID=1882438 RepID=UPI003D0D2FEC
MKYIYLLLFTLCLSTIATAQQTTRVDDNLLMEYYQSQRFMEAAEYLKKNFPEPVNDPKILSRLAYSSQMANKLVDAEGYYQRVYDLDTTNQNALFSMAGINSRRGNYLKAEMYYKRILAKDTTSFAVYTQLASIADRKNDTTGVMLYLQKANNLNPFDIDVASELSDAYVSHEHFEQALKVLNKAATNDPDNVMILLSMTKLTYSQKKWAETVEGCNKLIQLGTSNGEILNKLALAYYNLKKYACAAETFASLSGIQQNEYSYYYAGLCYKELKDNAQLIHCMKMAIFLSISPNVASYYGEMAGSEENLTHYKKAVQAYTKALQFSEDPTLYYLLANLYDTELKDKANAIKYYKKYLAAKPIAKHQTYIAYSKSRIEQLKN